MIAAVLVLAACDREPIALAPLEEPEGLPVPEWKLPFSDWDHDGWSSDEDCDDLDPEVHPEAAERCNGRDDNCDGYGESDLDGDGYPWCVDCDDRDPSSWPGAQDLEGDGTDQDCDSTDGQGARPPSPVLAGEAEQAWLGYALAAGDLDHDGCDDLLVGQPGIVYFTRTWDSAILTRGCWPWAETTVREGHNDYRGYNVDVAGDLLVLHDRGYRLGRGRAQVFDAATFHAGGPPLLDVTGDAIRAIDTLSLLGEGPQWLLYGRQGSYPPKYAHYGLIALPRQGVFDLEQQEPDEQITTDSQFFGDGGQVADIGDRDGDGHVDLGFGQQWLDDNTVYFFPSVTSGHLSDAPESWHKGGGEITDTRWVLSGDADLDGDGLDDALVGDVNDDVGSVPHAGRVYLVPWQGPGEFLLADAPARMDGELEWDWTGISSAAGDLDGDGQADLVVGAPGCWSCSSNPIGPQRPGKVMIFPGPLQGVLTRADAAALYVGEGLGDHLGGALALGDFDGNGRLDLAMSAPMADQGDPLEAGAVYVLIDPL